MASEGNPVGIESLIASHSRTDPGRDFANASNEVLEFLVQRVGFMHWLMLRFEGSARVLVQATSEFRAARSGESVQLPAPLIAAGEVDADIRFIPDTRPYLDTDSVTDSPAGPIRAYLEVPIFLDDGSRFGSLCAIDPMPQPEELKRDLSLVKVFASILGWLIQSEQESQELARDADHASVLAMTDELTGLPNRRAWNEIVSQESERSKRLGTSPEILIVDLDELKEVNDRDGHGAGDELLKSAGKAILGACRKNDFVARIGGDEYGVLVVGGGLGGLVRERVRAALEQQGIRASIGRAARRPSEDLQATIEEADAALFEEKRLKKGAGGRAAVRAPGKPSFRAGRTKNLFGGLRGVDDPGDTSS